jgi:hypothetical protein
MRPTLRLLSCLVPVLLASAASAQAPELPKSGGRDLGALLRERSECLAAVLDHAEEHRLQLLVGEVVHDASGRARLERSSLGDLGQYFYPASAIKLAAPPVALVQLNRWNQAHGTSFGLDTELVYLPLFDDEEREAEDATHLDGGRITVGHEIRKLHLVSDNQAFNRLFELAGYEALNRELHAAGFRTARVLHRLAEARGIQDNRRSPSILLRSRHDEGLTLPVRESDLVLDNQGLPGVEVGRAFQGGRGLIEGPHSFAHKNRIHLQDLQDLLVELVRPEVETGKRGFPELGIAQREFLREAMAQLPRESKDPLYDAELFSDDYVKLLLPGVLRVLPLERVRIWNKVGRAYGFTTENAYVEDLGTGRGFFVSAVLYTNPNGVLNDGVYAYESIADPYMADLGEALARALLRPEAGSAR